MGAVRVEPSPETSRPRVPWADVVRTGLVLGQLGLLLLLVQQFQLVSRTFFEILGLATAGFAIHAALPRNLRQPFFALLCLAGVPLTFGAHDGAWLLAIGLALAGMTFLPIAWSRRVGLILAVVVVLGLFRNGVLPFPGPDAIWTILGSMFMFRLAVYLYDLKHATTRPPVAQSLSYFFLLPNVCFPLFPIVDYKTFDRSWYDDDAFRIYQRGVQWMFRGMVQLILYRVVYYYLNFDPAQVHTLRDLMQYVYGVFLLYLKVSGSYHLIIGMLHLFGYRLPETNHRYWLSASFTDLWRRTNIYWKDAMMKLAYYPSYFVFRKRMAPLRALTLSMVLVFVLTWALHSWQWFWLRGEWLLSAHDFLFWMLLGVLVVWTSVREAIRQKSEGRAARGVDRGWSWRRGVGTVFTLTVLCSLWTLWNSDSVSDWVHLWPVALNATPMDVLLLLSLWALGVIIAGWAWDGPTALQSKAGEAVSLGNALRVAGTQSLLIGAVLVLGLPQVYRVLGPGGARIMASLKESRLNAHDETQQNIGYYENLGASQANSEVWAVQGVAQDLFQRGMRRRGDFVGKEMLPNLAMVLDGKSFHTNRWGMRDGDYTIAKPAGTCRLLFLGPSDVAGLGVHDDEVFDALLEERLARAGPLGRCRTFQALNLGIPNFSHLQQVGLLVAKGLQFHPDVVLMGTHSTDRQFNMEWLQWVLEQGIANPHDSLAAIVARTGARGDQPKTVVFRALETGIADVMRWNFAWFAGVVREAGAIPVLMVLRAPTMTLEYPADDLAAAADAGAMILDVEEIWGGHDEATLRISSKDKHMNAAGHVILADTLFSRITADPGAFGLPAGGQ